MNNNYLCGCEDDCDWPVVASDRPSFEQIALEMAAVLRKRSEDPHHKVGSIALRHDNSLAGGGYNGSPSGIDIDWTDRDARRNKVIHSEVNCLRYVKPGECKVLAVTTSPCAACLTNIASYGIKRVIFYDKFRDFEDVARIALEYGIELIQYER